MTTIKKNGEKRFSLVFSIALLILMTALIIPGVMGSSTNVNLGTAGNYVILSESGISTTGTTQVNGNMGVSPAAATAITGFGLVADSSNQFSTSSLVNGDVYAADYANPTPVTLTNAVNDMQAAYIAANAWSPTVTELGAGNIGGMTITPGVYKWSTGVTIPKDITLSGNSNDVWIFQIAQGLTTSSSTHVILSGGAQAKNVYWVVAGQTTLGTYSSFNGNILDQTSIVLNTGATLNGRALAQTAVILDANTVTTAAEPAAPSNSGSISSSTSVNLGTAANYAILAKAGVTTTPGTQNTRIYGNIGVSPIGAASITGFNLVGVSSGHFSKSSLVNGNVYAADYVAPTPATLASAISDMQTAYTTANAQTPGVTELGAGNIGSMTLAPGVYKWSTGVTIPSSVILDAQGNPNAVWIFQIAGVLSSGADSHVILTGGAQAQNIYWVVAGNTALGTNSEFNGNILDQSNIALGNDTTLNGRALAQTAVTLIGNTVTNPTAILAPSNSGSTSSSVNLGTAANYAILAKAGVTTTPGTQDTQIYGNIGVSPIISSSITGFSLVTDSSGLFSTSSLVNGNVYAADYVAPTPVTLASAVSDMQTAYITANAQTPGVTELGAGSIDNMTLTPGIYKWSTGVTIPNSVTLDAQGDRNAVWVFQIAGVLTSGAGSHVTLSGGAQAQNIYWVVAGNTELGANSEFNGNILDQSNIALDNGAILNGRALAQTAVTLNGNTVTNPTAILAPSNSGAATSVNLATAANYAILTKSGISTTPGTQNTRIYGNIGVSPIAVLSITGFGLVTDLSGQFSKSTLVNGNVYAADYVDPLPQP